MLIRRAIQKCDKCSKKAEWAMAKLDKDETGEWLSISIVCGKCMNIVIDKIESKPGCNYIYRSLD